MVTHAEALKNSIEYFGGNELAASAFVGKYALKNLEGELLESTPDEMHRRLSKEFARIEAKYPNPLSEEEIYQLLRKFKNLIPQGSPMAGIGNSFQTMSLSNCYVIGLSDSYGSIMKADEELAHVFRRRGGCGLDLSALRPEGMSVSNAAGTTTGVGTFMERFSNTCREVGQKSRRGAEMQTLSVHHPDILTFVNIKKDKTKVTGSNISVRLTDEFMQAVKTDSLYEQRWPVDSKTPKISKMVSAKDIWNEIITAAWESAEPGILFWDNVLKNSPADCYSDFGYKTQSTNPCLHESVLIATADGRNSVSIRQLAEEGKDIPVYSANPTTGEVSIKTGRNPRITGYNQPLVEVKLDNGTSFKVTPNHKFMLRDGTPIEARLLKSGDSLSAFNKTLEPVTKTLQRRFSSNEWLIFAKENTLPQDFSDWRKEKLGSVQELALACAIELGFEYTDKDPRLVKTLHNMAEQGYIGRITDNFVEVQKTCEQCKSLFFIQHEHREVSYCSTQCGLLHLNAESHIKSIRLARTQATYKKQSIDLKQQQSKIYSDLKFSLKRKPMLKEWEQACKDSGLSFRLKTKFGFQNIKELQAAAKTYNHKVVSVDPVEGLHTVYNITVDDNHTLAIISPIISEKYNKLWFTGANVFQCGEIPLSIGDACRLLLVNCMGNVKNPFSTAVKFDWDEFEKNCVLGQRLMDDLVDLELECVDRILTKVESDPEPAYVKQTEHDLWTRVRNACMMGRRTGLGLTAVGDVIASLGMRYASRESIEFIEKLYKTMEVASYRSSVQLAKERGAFPIFSYDLEKAHPFIQKILDQDPVLRSEYSLYGRRNIANTTTPPAGTTSLLACLSEEHHLFGTTSGIEPAYLISYTRRKKINPNDKGTRVDFVDDLGDSWQEYLVHHPGFKLWDLVKSEEYDRGLKETGSSPFYHDPKPENSPYWKSTSADVDWESGVELQAAAQRWICHSISRTANLPSTATKELVGNIYMKAWEAGCKGYTVYRDGSRSGVLVSNDQAAGNNSGTLESAFIQTQAPKRPKELECDIYQSTVNGEKWTIFVGLLDGKPYEIMAGLSQKISLPKRVKKGKLVKHNGEINPAIYNLHYDYDIQDGEAIVKDIGNIFENKTNSAFTRTLSLSLRHGAPVVYVVEQLNKGSDKESDLFSISKGIARVLKNYITDGTKGTAKKCPECKGDKLAFQEGCIRCLNPDCGYSKCG